MYFCFSVNVEAELPEYYRPLSLALYQVLEDIGASVDMRNIWQETWATRDIIQTISCMPEVSVFSFGSSREGTTTVDMNPDIDRVLVDNRFPVITDCSHVSGEKCLLFVQDNDTHAGYVKLQLVCNGIPLFQNCYGILNAMYFGRTRHVEYSTDKYNRLVVALNPVELMKNQEMERHGPAIFFNPDMALITSDTVIAFNLSKLPGCVEEWITRTRHYNWPPVDVIDHCKTLGCLFVPVGHPHSDEQHLEWRLSLSHQERLLVSRFSSVQHKCYILLKVWKKDILPLWIGQESLSSYHCKTCMFYMIENTHSNFWRPDNLLVCFVACLKQFLFWTTNGILPNYFIPTENMFDRRINIELRYNLQQELQNMLTQDCKYLAQISTSQIGDRLLTCATMPSFYRHFLSDGVPNYIRSKAILETRIVPIVFVHRHCCIQKCLSNSSQQCLINLYKFSQILKHTARITEHTEEETQKAISLIVPHLDLHHLTGTIALAKQQGRTREEICRFLFNDSWHQLNLRSDISVKLKQASLMYMFGYYHASLDVLTSIELRGVYSFCTCNGNREWMAPPTNDELIHFVSTQTTVECLVNRVFAMCIVYLPTERNVTPDALCYEMFRFPGEPTEHTVGLSFDFLREYAVVVGLFLFHFLLYLNHSKLNMRSHVRTDIDNMNYTISARGFLNMPKCSHREVCLNILGWVYKDQGCVETAMECFRRSLEMKPRGNAAALHLTVECFRRSLEMKPRGNAAALHLTDLQNTSQ